MFQYPPTAGEPVDAKTAEALTCFEKCLGKELIVTGAKEGGHSKGSAHETGQACDISEKRNPGITIDPNVNSCFNQCFPKGSWGQNKKTPPHLHPQTRPGKGGAQGYKK